MAEFKKMAVTIRHPGRGEGDDRVDIYEVPDYVDKDTLAKCAQAEMLGPFQVISVSDRVSEKKGTIQIKFNPEKTETSQS